MTEYLKPCPFCGDTDPDPEEVSYSKGNDPKTILHSPGCTKCGATIETVELWNRRETYINDALPDVMIAGASCLAQGDLSILNNLLTQIQIFHNSGNSPYVSEAENGPE